MATIPGVASNDLIRTSWGTAIVNELNNKCLKVDGLNAAGTAPAGMTGSLIVQASPTLRLRQGGNVPVIYFENTAGAGAGTGPFAFINGQSDGLHYQANVGSHRFNLASGVEVMELASGILKVTGIGRFGVATASEAMQIYGITTGNNYAFIGFYPSATSVDAPGARAAYVGHAGTGLKLHADTGNVVVDSAAGAASVNADLGVNLTAGTQITLDATTTVTVNGTDITIDGSDDVIVDATGSLSLGAGNAEFIGFALGGTTRGAWKGTKLLVGKNATDATDAGVEVSAEGDPAVGRIMSTTAVSGTQNLYARHEGSADANGQTFAAFLIGATVAGSISQKDTDSCNFNAGPGGTHTATSDYRLKDDLGPIVDPVGKLKALQPKHLAWKASGDEFDGFIAHEVAPVAANAVTGTKDAVFPADHPDAPGGIDPQGLDTSKLVPLLTAALQDALTQIETLSARIDALEGGAP